MKKLKKGILTIWKYEIYGFDFDKIREKIKKMNSGQNFWLFLTFILTDLIYVPRT